MSSQQLSTLQDGENNDADVFEERIPQNTQESVVNDTVIESKEDDDYEDENMDADADDGFLDDLCKLYGNAAPPPHCEEDSQACISTRELLDVPKSSCSSVVCKTSKDVKCDKETVNFGLASAVQTSQTSKETQVSSKKEFGIQCEPVTFVTQGMQCEINFSTQGTQCNLLQEDKNVSKVPSSSQTSGSHICPVHLCEVRSENNNDVLRFRNGNRMLNEVGREVIKKKIIAEQSPEVSSTQEEHKTQKTLSGSGSIRSKHLEHSNNVNLINSASLAEQRGNARHNSTLSQIRIKKNPPGTKLPAETLRCESQRAFDVKELFEDVEGSEKTCQGQSQEGQLRHGKGQNNDIDTGNGDKTISFCKVKHSTYKRRTHIRNSSCESCIDKTSKKRKMVRHHGANHPTNSCSSLKPNVVLVPYSDSESEISEFESTHEDNGRLNKTKEHTKTVSKFHEQVSQKPVLSGKSVLGNITANVKNAQTNLCSIQSQSPILDVLDPSAKNMNVGLNSWASKETFIGTESKSNIDVNGRLSLRKYKINEDSTSCTTKHAESVPINKTKREEASKEREVAICSNCSVDEVSVNADSADHSLRDKFVHDDTSDIDDVSENNIDWSISSKMNLKNKRRLTQQRMPYLNEERKVIVEYIRKHKFYHLVYGRALWQHMERDLYINRTWQSMKEHFLKKILPKIESFHLDPETTKKFISLRKY